MGSIKESSGNLEWYLLIELVGFLGTTGLLWVSLEVLLFGEFKISWDDEEEVDIVDDVDEVKLFGE